MDDVRLRIRLPTKLADKLRKLADRDHASVSRVIELILHDALLFWGDDRDFSKPA